MKAALFFSLLFYSAAFGATEEQLNKRFEVPQGGTLIVDVGFGAIDVSTNATDVVAIKVWREIARRTKVEEERFLSNNPVQFIHDGSTITVRTAHLVAEKPHWFSGLKNRNEAKYAIQVPANFNARLQTSGGGIGISDLTGEFKADTSGGELRFTRLQGPLQGDTSGGGIRVVDCVGQIRVDTSGGGIAASGGSGSLEADSSGGSIEIKGFHGPVSVDTSGGGITIENVVGRVTGETSGGPIQAVLPAPVPGDVKLSTSGGGITVRLPESAAFNLEAESTGGGVSCDLPITVQGKVERDRLQGTVNGGGPTLRLSTSGGGVHVKKL